MTTDTERHDFHDWADLHVELLLDGSRGCYLPRDWAEVYGETAGESLQEDVAILLDGPSPKNEWYWEVWTRILDFWQGPQGECLYQDGDLFLISEPETAPDGFWDYWA